MSSSNTKSNMKFYFNRRPVSGPWGGGSKVITAICEESVRRGHEIFFENDIHKNEFFDIIFCSDPRPGPTSFDDLLAYRTKNPRTKLIQRVGDLGTHGKPDLFMLVKASTKFADLVIFPSNWAKNFSKIDGINSITIENAPIKTFFAQKPERTADSPIRLVSHHWSNNQFKGFEVYEALDKFCNLRGGFTFTFIGRKPEGCFLTNHVPPKDAQQLSEELAKHDIYITASKREAGANHVLEAMALGLPVLFHRLGGSINEYCDGRGLVYDDADDLIRKLEDPNLVSDLLSFKKPYTRNSDQMASEYVDVFERFVS